MMVERVLDTRISNVSEDGDVAEVSGQVAIVFSDLHLSLQSKKYDKLLSANGFDTVGALKVVTSQDLLELGVLQGHLALVLNALFPPEDQPESVGTAVVPTLPPQSTITRAKSGPEFCELTATGAPASKGFRAWVIKFIVHLHLLVLPSTIEAVRRAGQDPLNLGAEWLVSNEQGRIVFDALVSCGPSGLPSDLLLSFSPDILTGALGVAAIAFISRMVLVVTDEGAAVLQAWFNQPPPVTKKWMLGPGLVQWSRTLEQLVACDCAPSLVAQRLSLYHLVSKVPELVPELAALRVACKDPAGVAIEDLVDLVRRKGEAFNSEKQTQQAVATMCFAGVAEEDSAGGSTKVCPWWKKGTCRWGPRCKWIHEGPAGVAAVARSRKAPVGKEKSPVGSKKSSVNADLKAMLLELLAGLATSLNCPVRRLLTKICGRLQTPRNCMRVTQSRRAVPVESQPVPVGSQSYGFCQNPEVTVAPDVRMPA